MGTKNTSQAQGRVSHLLIGIISGGERAGETQPEERAKALDAEGDFRSMQGDVREKVSRGKVSGDKESGEDGHSESKCWMHLMMMEEDTCWTMPLQQLIVT